MAYEFKLPDLGEGLTEGEIARWLVSEGQDVAEDDPLVEIQTDKTTVEIPSPAAGKVTRILVEEGKVVPVGTVLVVIGGEPDGDQPRAETQAAREAVPEPPARLCCKVRQGLFGRRPWFARSRRSSGSTSRPSRERGRKGALPRRTCGRQAAARKGRAGANRSAACAA